MTALLQRVKRRLGPLWWYSALLMVALRLGDAVNAFIGLFLIPRYVPESELGAILPLMRVGTLLALPLSVLTTLFVKYINVYSVRGETGKVKRMLRDIMVFGAVLFVVILLGASFLAEAIFERMRVSGKLLGLLVIAASVAGVVATVFNSVLQALKKFRLSAIASVTTPPLRLLVLLAVLPFFPLSGYFVGLLVPSIYLVCLALWGLRHIMSRANAMQSYWQEDGAAMLRYLLPVAAWTFFMSLQSTCEVFVIRHRLPDADSAAYYMISRFAEIATYLGSTIAFVLFPLASEEHERRSAKGARLLWQSAGAALGLGLLLALALRLGGGALLRLVPAGRAYTAHAPKMAWLTVVLAMRAAITCIAVHEMACRRFRFILPAGLAALCQSLLLYGLTGYEFFAPWIPSTWLDWMAGLEAARLEFMLAAMFWFSLLALAGMTVQQFARATRPKQACSQ